MFDLPEPFGPTTTATPGSRRTSTASGNDLKPRSLIARRCTRAGDYGAQRMPPRPESSLVLDHPGERGTRELVGHVSVALLDVSLGVVEHLVVGLAADRLAAGAVDHLGHRASSRLVAAMLRRGRKPVERLLGRRLRAARADAGLLAVDQRRTAERAVVRRALHVENVVDHLPALSGELFLKLRLVVDVSRQRIGDAPVEGRDDRLSDRLEAMLEIERRQRRLEQRREHVAVLREPLELVGR